MLPDLSISLINHSNPSMLRDCLRSIYAGTHTIILDVWVVDNATGGAGVAEMQAEFPQVHWIFNAQRQGFSANHNQVLRQAKSRYACILNDDTIIHDGAFDTLIKFMDENPKIGMAGAKLLNADGSLQNCTFRFMTLLSELIGICFLPGPLNSWKTIGIDSAQFHNQVAEVDWVLGACIVVRDRTLGEVGLLDSELSPIANTEEVDWCYRVHKANWKVAYCPSAVITHYGGQSMKPLAIGADRFRVEMYRTRLAFFRKHYGQSQTLLLRLIYLVTLPWNIVMLSQSALRKTITPEHRKVALSTLYGIVSVSLRFRGGTA